MAEIDVGADTFEVYALTTDPLDDADIYLGGAVHASTWRAETSTDVRGRHLVTSTRLIDRQVWPGEKNVSTQALAWPRKNTGIAGVVDSVTPTDIVHASFELASAILDGSDVQDAQNQAQKIEQLKAGSVQLKFFRQAEGPPIRFPMIVFELLRPYLSSGANIVGVSTGVDGETISDRDFGFNRGL